VTLFVDTSAWYAAIDRSDRDHGRAIEVLAARQRRLTTDHVLLETWVLLRSRLSLRIADTFWQRVRDGIADVEMTTAADLDAAWRIRQAFPDQDFSVVDMTSFAVMERLKLTRVASFDEHFAIYRYGRNRRVAFEVVS
jgi:predicted nucleic acid-binding protein